MFAAWLLCVLSGADPFAGSTTTIDAGQVFVGQRLVRKFTLRNSAAEVMTITGVKASCGCAAPELSRRQLQPGESAELTLDVNTLSQPAGPIRWNAHVDWHCGAQKGRSTFELTAHLIREIEVEPAALALQAQPGFQHEILVKDHRTDPFHVTGVRTSSNVIRAEYIAERRSIRVCVAETCPEGTSSDVVTIATDDRKYPELRVPITVTRTAPARIVAYPARPNLTPSASVLVQLRGRDGETMRVERVETGHAALTSRWTEGPGPFATLRIGLDKSKWDGQGIASELRVRFATPAGETLIIPVTLRIDE